MSTTSIHFTEEELNARQIAVDAPQLVEIYGEVL